jgi:Iron/zinc purple acid phosphatase-like protein C
MYSCSNECRGFHRSAYREPSFGHGILIVENATHAVWEWHRNEDAADVISDQTYFVRDPEKCVGKVPVGAPAPQQPIITLPQGRAFLSPANASATAPSARMTAQSPAPISHLPNGQAPVVMPTATAPFASGG